MFLGLVLGFDDGFLVTFGVLLGVGMRCLVGWVSGVECLCD